MRLVGIRSALRLVDDTRQHVTASSQAVDLARSSAGRIGSGIRSPWSGGTLTPVIWKDIYGLDGVDAPIGRAEALTIPAVAKGLSLVMSALADCPLVALPGVAPGNGPVAPLPDQPAWLWQTSGSIAPQYRLAFTVEDLILVGWSLWALDRDSAGDIVEAVRVRPDLWDFGDGGGVELDRKPLRPKAYILIKGPHDGILNTGKRTLRGAIDLELAWQRVVRNPIPATVLHQVGDDQLTDEEVDDLLNDWRAARQDPDGAVAFIPASLNVEAVGTVIADVMTEARNAVAVDVARLIGVPAVSLDAGPVQTSLTYANTETANGSTLPLYGLAPYAKAIGYALSMDNVVPSGVRVAVDMTQLLADSATISRTGTPTED